MTRRERFWKWYGSSGYDWFMLGMIAGAVWAVATWWALS